ncbi:MAG: hypothetical protein SA378_11240 [Sedimentibacter sp.]|nr:hypothetical protein [Sedimentibacter sp.]MDW5300689.1 hypothetical protein [Sedimentibacter sp.]
MSKRFPYNIDGICALTDDECDVDTDTDTSCFECSTCQEIETKGDDSE